MQNRLRLLMGATALLYFGPLLAGLGGFGWALVPVFVAIFFLWLFVLRPQQWPRHLGDWARPEALVTLAAQGAVQVLLVTVLFAIGRGIGGVLGAVPAFPLILPVAISFLSVPLSRLIWDPWKAAETNAFLDHALREVSTPGHARTPAPQPTLAAHLLAALPKDLTADEIAAHLRAIEAQSDAPALAEALIASLATNQPHLRQALAVHATTAAVVAQVANDYPAIAFANLVGDDQLTGLFATRCAAMLAQDPTLWGACPSADLLDQRASTATPATASALRALADQTRRLSPAQG